MVFLWCWSCDVMPVWKNCDCVDGVPVVLILWPDAGVKELWLCGWCSCGADFVTWCRCKELWQCGWCPVVLILWPDAGVKNCDCVDVVMWCWFCDLMPVWKNCDCVDGVLWCWFCDLMPVWKNCDCVDGVLWCWFCDLMPVRKNCEWSWCDSVRLVGL